MKTKINAQIVAHSVNEQGDELISVLATFPRIILAEVNTHRMLSKNTSSSRAIPFKKMVETIQNDPFIPIAWQKEHKGMQGSEYFTDPVDLVAMEANWLLARDRAVSSAWWLNEGKLTKQLCNRLLEPFMWTTMLITGPKSGWKNFFKLRCPQYDLSQIRLGSYKGMTTNPICKSWKEVVSRTELDLFNTGPYKIDDALIKELSNYSDIQKLKLNKGQAEIHIMALAECIWDAYNESTPKVLKPGEWHIPFEDKINIPLEGTEFATEAELQEYKMKVSVAMAARTSYTVVGEEKGLDYEAMIGLHDRLLSQDPPHSSPLEHCARCMSDEEYSTYLKGKGEWFEHPFDSSLDQLSTHKKMQGWCNNFKGFIPYRYMVDNGKVD